MRDTTERPKVGFSSWIRNIFSVATKPQQQGPPLGTVWSSQDAERAFARGEMKSRDGGKPLRVAFRNKSTIPLLLSWVAENGKCHHFYSLKPAEIIEGPVTALDHIETTKAGHSFCIACAGGPAEEDEIRSNGAFDPSLVIGGYRPENPPPAESKKKDNTSVQLVTISQRPVKKFKCCSPPTTGTSGTTGNLRGSSEEKGNSFDDLCWVVHVQWSEIDSKQINTCDKIYQKITLGGWPVRAEPNWHGGDETLERRLAEDLEMAAKCLPEHCREYLRRTTPIWVNKTFKWGPEVKPITGKGLCFHPEKDWLVENSMHEDKCECIELYDSKGYLEDCKLWGRAGVLVHELSHAYHHKCTEQGYSNPEILECYKQAMKERLYDWVRVHGRQGPMNRAYASSNAMEYFAELSAAFLGQPNMHSAEEFNKWYPFNRRQIKEHDPRAYKLLKQIWKVSDD
jgi:hypothetical protein